MTGFKLYATSANIVVVPCKRTQQGTTLLGPTMLGVVGQQCWVRLHGPLESVVCGMEISDQTDFKCGTCTQGKMCQTRSQKPDERATTSLEFVHCYLAGPISPVARDGLYQGGGKGLATQLHILASSSFVLWASRVKACLLRVSDN